jgi:hypothetical protein
VRLADERHVVLAQGIELDVADDDHLIALRFEQCAVGDVFRLIV